MDSSEKSINQSQSLSNTGHKINCLPWRIKQNNILPSIKDRERDPYFVVFYAGYCICPLK